MNDPMPFHGHLVIYVDGCKVRQKNMVHFFPQNDGTTIGVPDRLLLPPRHEVGSDEWWHEGWAVGDNSRGRLCMRFGLKPLLKFKDYDEAVSYGYKRQQKFKKQQHVLVYVSTDWSGRARSAVVRGMDDIDAIEALLAEEKRVQDEGIAQRRAEFAQDHPHFDQLREKFGMSRSYALSDLLLKIRCDGLEAVGASMPRSSFARALRDIESCGIIVRNRKSEK